VSRLHRNLLGGAAVLALLGGASLWALTDQARLGSVLIRVGMVLAALWLVAPQVRRPGRAGVVFLAVVTAVLLRPKLLWPALIGTGLYGLARRRGSR
jgi:hypothetical protein